MKLNNLRMLGVALLLCIFTLFVTKGVVAAITGTVVSSLAIALLQPRAVGTLFAYTGTTIAEIFIPEVYGSIIPNDRTETSAFSQSGVVTRNALLQQAAMSGARKVEVPIWNDLDPDVEPNLSDDTDTLASVGKVDTSTHEARNAFLNKGYGTADLAAELAGAATGQGDPMTRIRNRFGTYWQRQFQRRIIAASRGIMAKNLASDGGDMIHDISLETTVGVGDANRISAEAVVESIFSLGDQFGEIGVIAMHSIVYKRLVLQQLIEYVKDATGSLQYESYLGKRVVVDDGLPVIAGTTSGFRYVTILFGQGAIGFGEGRAKVPVELDRIAAGGNGGGLENLWERKTWLIHPYGHNWTESSVAGESATLAELRNAANWTRVLPRKVVPIAFLITNG